MPEHPLVRVYNEAQHHRKVTLHPLPWWKACSRVEPEQVREAYKRDEFSILRAKGITKQERERLRELVSEARKKQYLMDTRIQAQVKRWKLYD